MSRTESEGGRCTAASDSTKGNAVRKPRKGFEFSARARSFRYAGRGLRELLTSEHNAWIHAAATGLVVALAIVFPLSGIEWGVVILAIAAVWCAEAMNTAIELLADATTPEPHSLVAKAKDVAAGGVLVTALGAAIVGLLIFVPHISVWLRGTPG